MKLIGKNTVMAAVLATAVTGVGGVALAPSASAATRTCSSGTSISHRPTVRYGDTGSCVRELQTQLNKHGAKLVRDGIFGPATRAATKKYQGSVGIAKDGVVGPITWGKLLRRASTPKPTPKSSSCSTHPTVRYGSRGSCVVTLQKLLVRNGYSVGAAGTDGVFGRSTLSAVRSYQGHHGLVADGIVGPLTWGKLLGKKVASPPPAKAPSGNKLSSGISTTRSAIMGCQNTTGYSLLTFDDGISPSKIDPLLNTLKAKNVRAVFFFTGDYARANPTVMNKIKKAGMLLGNHTYSHPALSPLSDASIRSQINNGVHSTVSPKLLRPPYGDGAFTSRLQTIAKSMGYGLCYWQVDTRDWDKANTNSAADIIRRVRYGDKWTPPVSPGGVVLMHGTGVYSVAATSGVIDAMRARGANPLPLR